VHLLPGMTVRHALIAAQLPDALASGKIVRDELGNEVGEGGALMEGSRLYVT
jgi:hypothetical protein